MKVNGCKWISTWEGDLGSGKQYTDIWNLVKRSGFLCLPFTMISRQIVNLEKNKNQIKSTYYCHWWRIGLGMAWWALDINELAWLDASIHHNTNAILNKKGKHVRKLSAKVFWGIFASVEWSKGSPVCMQKCLRILLHSKKWEIKPCKGDSAGKVPVSALHSSSTPYSPGPCKAGKSNSGS